MRSNLKVTLLLMIDLEFQYFGPWSDVSDSRHFYTEHTFSALHCTVNASISEEIEPEGYLTTDSKNASKTIAFIGSGSTSSVSPTALCFLTTPC